MEFPRQRHDISREVRQQCVFAVKGLIRRAAGGPGLDVRYTGRAVMGLQRLVVFQACRLDQRQQSLGPADHALLVASRSACLDFSRSSSFSACTAFSSLSRSLASLHFLLHPCRLTQFMQQPLPLQAFHS